MGLITKFQISNLIVTPDYRIIADSADDQDYAADITARIADRLLSLELSDESGLKSDALQLTLDDREHRIITPRKGVELRCYMGYRESGLFDMGIFVVDEVDISGPPAKMVIRAKAVALEDSGTVSGLTGKLKEERTRSWHGLTLGQIIQTIARESGYGTRIDSELAAVPVSHVDQTAESDMNFLTRIAYAFDAAFKVAGSNLLFLSRNATIEGLEKVLIHGPLSDQSASDTVLEWNLSSPERQEYGRVVATYYDQAAAEIVEVVAGSDGLIKTLGDPYPDFLRASRAANAELNRLRRAKNEGSLTVVGNPLLMAETIAVCDGFRPELNGEWLVDKAQHVIDDQGYRTSINFKSRGDTNG